MTTRMSFYQQTVRLEQARVLIHWASVQPCQCEEPALPVTGGPLCAVCSAKEWLKADPASTGMGVCAGCDRYGACLMADRNGLWCAKCGGWGDTKPKCTSCASTVGRPPSPAIVKWTGPSGVVSYLCHSCLGTWVRQSEADPSLEPQSVSELFSA